MAVWIDGLISGNCYLFTMTNSPSLFIHPFLSIHLSIYLSTYLSIHGFYSYTFESISINLSVHLFLYLSPRLTPTSPNASWQMYFWSLQTKISPQKKKWNRKKKTLWCIYRITFVYMYVCMDNVLSITLSIYLPII